MAHTCDCGVWPTPWIGCNGGNPEGEDENAEAMGSGSARALVAVGG